MSEEFYSLVTDYCLTKQLECIQNGTSFDVYEIALGDGSGKYYEPDTSQTELVNEVWRGEIEKCEWEDNKFYCIATVPADEGGFTVREAGIFDTSGNLLVISKFPETYKQSPDTGTVKQLTIRIELELTNEELTELIINPDIDSVTKDEFESVLDEYQKTNEKGEPDGYAPLDETGLIPIAYIPDITTQSILTPFCLNSCELDSKGNPDLLTSETIKVLKYTSSTLGVFYTDIDFTLEKDGVVYSDVDLTESTGTIVAVDEENNTISFGTIETLSEDEDNPLHYSATTIGDFYVEETLELGVSCYSDSEYTDLIGVVTYLNLTKISIGEVETYTSNGYVTSHIYITAKSPFTYTTAKSITYEVNEDLVLDVIDLCPEDEEETEEFNLFVNYEEDGYSLIALSNTIFTQMIEPDEQELKQVWTVMVAKIAADT